MRFVAIFAHADFAGLPNSSYVIDTDFNGIPQGPQYAEVAAKAMELHYRATGITREPSIVLTEGDAKFYAEKLKKRLRKD